MGIVWNKGMNEMKEISEIKKDLKEKLSKKRYEHTMGVMYTAASMAMCFGVNVEQAILAGLLHDCAKYLSDKEKLSACKKYKLEITPLEHENKELLHAKIGAAFARDLYGVKDEEVLNAIRWHTTGKPDMTPLEEIIFIADYIEPNRKQLPGMEQIRFLAFHNLTDCIVQIIENTLQYLEGKKSLVDTSSRTTYEFYKQKQESEHE